MNKLIAAAGFAALVSTLPSVGVAQDKKDASPHTFTGNVGFVTDYRYRGISQTDIKPALQGGFDYSHASGIYLGTWASNVSWLSDQGAKNSLEWDFFGGYKGTAGDFGYDVGLLQYAYVGNKLADVGGGGVFKNANTTEIYGALTYGPVTGKLSRIAPQAQKDEGATLFDVEIELDPGQEVVLRAGYSANAEIVIREKHEVVMIPERLIVFSDDGSESFVERPGEGEKAEPVKVAVKLGLSDGLNVEIEEGLAVGDQVVQRPPREVGSIF